METENRKDLSKYCDRSIKKKCETCMYYKNSLCTFVPMYKNVIEDEAEKEFDNFDLFEGRVKSLLDRWRKMHDEYLEETNLSSYCIKGFLQEINDAFTQSMIEK